MKPRAEIINICPQLAGRKTSEIGDLIAELAIAEQHVVVLMDKLSALGSRSMVQSDPNIRENVLNAMRGVEAACEAFELARDEMAIATNRIYIELFADHMPELPNLSEHDIEMLDGFDLEEVVREIEAAD